MFDLLAWEPHLLQVGLIALNLLHESIWISEHTEGKRCFGFTVCIHGNISVPRICFMQWLKGSKEKKCSLCYSSIYSCFLQSAVASPCGTHYCWKYDYDPQVGHILHQSQVFSLEYYPQSIHVWHRKASVTSCIRSRTIAEDGRAASGRHDPCFHLLVTRHGSSWIFDLYSLHQPALIIYYFSCIQQIQTAWLTLFQSFFCCQNISGGVGCWSLHLLFKHI